MLNIFVQATKGGRYVVSVHSSGADAAGIRSMKLPKVFAAPVRPDVIKEIFELVRKNKRMAHGVSPKAGEFIF